MPIIASSMRFTTRRSSPDSRFLFSNSSFLFSPQFHPPPLTLPNSSTSYMYQEKLRNPNSIHSNDDSPDSPSPCWHLELKYVQCSNMVTWRQIRYRRNSMTRVALPRSTDRRPPTCNQSSIHILARSLIHRHVQCPFLYNVSVVELVY